MSLNGSSLKVASIDHGCCIRVEGQGTMNESQAAREVAMRTLETSPQSSVVFDLTDCSYLDSTFLGCVLDLYRRYGRAPAPRFVVAAPQDTRHKLFSACGIDRYLASIDTAPEVQGTWVALPPAAMDRHQLMQHVMECHRTLAQIDSPMKLAFAKIANEIEKDLNKV